MACMAELPQALGDGGMSASRRVTRLLAAWMPVRALVRRELLTTLRLRRTYAMLFALVVVLGFVAVVTWPSERVSWSMRGNWAREFMLWNSLLLLLAGALVVPAFAGSAVVNERERRTLELLWGTGIRPFTLVLAKFLASMGLYALFVFAVFPLLAVSYFLVGVDVGLLALVLVELLLTAAAVSAAGLWVSCRVERGLFALAAAFILMLFVQGGHVLSGLLALETLRIPSSGQYEDLVFGWSLPQVPGYAIAFAVLEGGGWAGMTNSFEWMARAIAFQVVFCLIFLWLARRAAAKHLGAYESTQAPNREAAPVAIKEAGAASRYRTVRAGVWTMARFEMRDVLSGIKRMPRWLMALIAVGVVIPFAILGWERGDSGATNYPGSLHGFYALLQGLAAMIAPIFAAGYRIRERQLGNEDALRMTLLRPGTVFWGKQWGGLAWVFAAWMVAVVLSAFMWRLEDSFPHERLLHAVGLITVLVCGVQAFAIATWFGTRMKEVGGTLGATFLVLLAIHLALPVFLGWLSEEMGWMDRRSGRYAIEWYTAASPIWSYFDVAWMIRYARLTSDVGGWFAAMLGHGVLTISLLLLAQARFTRDWRTGAG